MVENAILKKTLKIEFWISIFVRLSILGVLIPSIIEKQYMLVFAASSMLIISFVPSIIGKRYQLVLPPEFEIIVSLFLYATFILGEMKSYYFTYWWWDILLHSFSAFILGLIGFVILYTFHYVEKINLSPIIAAIFSFNFAVTLGVMWEIFEFAADQFLGLNMQKSGIMDTMTDLIVDSIGALIGAVMGYFYLKGGDSLIIKRIVEKFVRQNFNRKRKITFSL